MTDLSALAGATIVFDLDGTLVDSAPDLVGTLNALLLEQGAAPVSFEQGLSFIGEGARRLLERGFEARGLPTTPEVMGPMFDRFLAHYDAHSTDLTRPYPGVVAALTRLRAAGARLAICTNKLTPLSEHILEKLDLARFFDAVIGPDRAPAAKPDPRHLLATIAAAGGDVDRSVMVGDAATDADAARAARVPLLLVSFGYAHVPPEELKPDVLIDRYEDLGEALLRLLPPSP